MTESDICIFIINTNSSYGYVQVYFHGFLRQSMNLINFFARYLKKI